MVKADFGVSMVVAPAYLLYLKVSQYWSFYSFGMSQYVFQAFLLLLMIILLQRFRLTYLFAFVASVIYGFMLDGCTALMALLPFAGIWYRLICYLLGLLICAIGVALLFHTYLTPELYELFVMEIAEKLHWKTHRFKMIYDCVSCLLGVVLSFAFFGMWHFEGVKLGTILCALVNGTLIGWCSRTMEHIWNFEDLLPLRRFFEGEKKPEQQK